MAAFCSSVAVEKLDKLETLLLFDAGVWILVLFDAKVGILVVFDEVVTAVVLAVTTVVEFETVTPLVAVVTAAVAAAASEKAATQSPT